MKNSFKKIILLSLFLIPLYSSAAETTSIFVPTNSGGAVLSISDDNSSYFINDEFSVDIFLDTKNSSIEGVDIVYLNYDPTFLELIDADNQKSGIQIKAGSLMSNTVANSVSGGKILFSQTSAGGSNFSGKGILATIKFKALKVGSTALTFDFEKGSTVDTNVASAGKDILGATIDRTYTLKEKSGNNNSSDNNSSAGGGASSNSNSNSNSSSNSAGGGASSNSNSNSNLPNSNTTKQAARSQNLKEVSDGDIIKLEKDPKIYLIENGKRKHIPSAEEFNKRGFKWSSIKTVSKDILDKYQEESYIKTKTSSNNNNTKIILKAPGSPKIYLIENGKRKHIPSAEEFNKRGFKWSSIKTVSIATLNQYQEEDYFLDETNNQKEVNLKLIEGSLLKFSDSPKVYIVVASENKIVHIPTYEAFVSAGFNFSQVKNKDAKERNKYKILLLVKGSGPKVYFLDPNKRVRKHIVSPEVFNSYSENRWQDIAVIPEKYLDMYKDVNLIKIKNEPTVYFLDGKVKRKIPTLEIFNKNGFKWQDVMRVNKFELDYYPLGKPLS